MRSSASTADLYGAAAGAFAVTCDPCGSGVAGGAMLNATCRQHEYVSSDVSLCASHRS